MAVLRIRGLTHAEARVLAVIAFHDGPPYGAIPSAARIGRECGGMAARTVLEHIAAMVRKGVLTAIKRQRTSRYVVHYAVAPPPPETRRPPEPELQFPDLRETRKSENPDLRESRNPDLRESRILTCGPPAGKPEGSRKNEPVASHPRAGAREGRDTVAAFSAWNELAEAHGLALVTTAYPQQDRVTALTARLAECGGIDGWHAALARVAASDRLTGGMDSGWRCTLDWLLKPDRFRSVVEGQWDNREPTGRGSKIEQEALELLERDGI